jgi:hypothetical protein
MQGTFSRSGRSWYWLSATAHQRPARRWRWVTTRKGIAVATLSAAISD